MDIEGARYKKSVELAAEWESLGSPDQAGFWQRLGEASLETMVTARRVYGLSEHASRIEEALAEPVMARIRQAARALAGDGGADLQEELAEELLASFWEELLSSRESFYEIHFNRALWLRARTIRRSLVETKRARVEMWAARIVLEPAEEVLSGREVAEELIASPTDDITELEQDLDWAIILDALPREVAQAVDLHYNARLKVSSSDPSEPTVTGVLGCSERKVWQLLSAGRVLAGRFLEAGQAEGHHGANEEEGC